MRVLGIDPGYERLGVAILEGTPSTQKLIHSECVHTSADDDFVKRLHEAVTRVSALLNEYSPDALALEKLYFNTNQKTAMHVAEIRGALIYLGTEKHLGVFEYTPSQIKNAVTGYGKSDKAQVMSMLHSLVTLPEKKMLDDEYDAIAVALTCVVSEKPLK